MLSGLLVLAGVLAGVTGTWSPCGLSAIDTLAGWGAARGRATLLRAAGAFGLGSLAGGAATFAALGLLGSLLPARARPGAALVAAALAVAAAAADLSGARIRPQIRRQVPEPWRRRLAPSCAAGAYGVLLGLGFTTYVLAFALWALALVDVLLGRPGLGLALGLAFGAGRALPVLALAPLAQHDVGLRITAAMTERPRLLRGLRAAGGVALAACALALALGAGAAGAAGATTSFARGATDPSYAGAAIAWEASGDGGGARWIHQGVTSALPGDDPALGGQYIAVRVGDGVIVIARATGAAVLTRNVPGAQKLAVSDSWLAVRAASGSGQEILAFPLAGGDARTVAKAKSPEQLSRPALSGSRLAFARNGPQASRIVLVDLDSGKSETVRRTRIGQLLNPDIVGGRMLYVQLTRCGQRLRSGSAGRAGADHTLLALGPLAARDRGYEHGHTSQGSGPSHCRPNRARSKRELWTTALAPHGAFVTVLRPGSAGLAGSGEILRVRR